jgi:hypothetical protein
MVKGYLKRPPLVGALDQQCFCMHRVILQVAEGSGASHRGLEQRNEVVRHMEVEVEGYKP